MVDFLLLGFYDEEYVASFLDVHPYLDQKLSKEPHHCRSLPIHTEVQNEEVHRSQTINTSAICPIPIFALKPYLELFALLFCDRVFQILLEKIFEYFRVHFDYPQVL